MQEIRVVQLELEELAMQAELLRGACDRQSMLALVPDGACLCMIAADQMQSPLLCVLSW